MHLVQAPYSSVVHIVTHYMQKRTLCGYDLNQRPRWHTVANSVVLRPVCHECNNELEALVDYHERRAAAREHASSNA